MQLSECDKSKFYMRSHWTDYYIKYNKANKCWQYDKGSSIGATVHEVLDLYECDKNNNLLVASPTYATYTSNNPYNIIRVEFQNSPHKYYEYKVPATSQLNMEDYIVTETKKQLSIAKIVALNIQNPDYPEDKLAWIYGIVSSIRESEKELATTIIEGIINEK